MARQLYGHTSDGMPIYSNQSYPGMTTTVTARGGQPGNMTAYLDPRTGRVQTMPYPGMLPPPGMIALNSSMTQQYMWGTPEQQRRFIAEYGPQGGSGGNQQGAYEQEVRDLLSGNADRIMNDPYYQTSLDFYQGAARGQNVPFTDEVINQLYGRQADMNAAAQASQAQQMTDRYAATGGSIYDPSHGAEQLALQAARQTANAGARRDIDINATAGNYDARSAGAAGLAGVRGQQIGQASGLRSQLAGYLAGAEHTQDVYGGIPQTSAASVPRTASVSVPQTPPRPQAQPQQQASPPRRVTPAQARTYNYTPPRRPVSVYTPQSDIPDMQPAPQPVRVSGGAPAQDFGYSSPRNLYTQ
jgi:hypothetical protein